METPNDKFSDIQFQCPSCGMELGTYQETCPQCGHELSEEFYATYKPRVPVTMRVVAGLLLLGVILVPVLLIVWHLLLWRMP